jgi:hypothetical protein
MEEELLARLVAQKDQLGYLEKYPFAAANARGIDEEMRAQWAPPAPPTPGFFDWSLGVLRGLIGR